MTSSSQPDVDRDGPAPQPPITHLEMRRPGRLGRLGRLRQLPWSVLLLEAFITVLAIVLALAADDWRQQREDRALADAALGTFARELTDNRRRLLAVRPYHDSLFHGFNRAAEIVNRGQPLSLEVVHPEFRGVQPPMLLSTAWESALTTGALRHVDYATIQQLAAVYASQQSLADLNRVMFASLVSPDVIGRGDMTIAARLGAVFFSDIVPLERRLERDYEAILRRLPAVDTLDGSE